MIQHAVGIFCLRNGGFAAVRFSVPKESIFGDGRDVVFFVALFGIKKGRKFDVKLVSCTNY